MTSTRRRPSPARDALQFGLGDAGDALPAWLSLLLVVGLSAALWLAIIKIAGLVRL